MQVSYPVFIPSKGREKSCYTANILAQEGVPFTIVVEPQDAAKYTAHHGPNANIAMMPENNKGIAYARNWCKQLAIRDGHQKYWCIDDNIKAFRRRADGQNRRVVAKIALGEIEHFVDSYQNIGIASLTHSVFAWTRKEDIGLNQQPYSCMLLRSDIDIWYRENIIEDTDYAMQLLNHPGMWCTVIFYKLLMDKATSATMKGGNTEISHSGMGREQRSRMLMEMWPKWFKLRRNKKGEIRVAPSRVWKSFKQELIENEQQASDLCDKQEPVGDTTDDQSPGENQPAIPSSD